MANVTRGSANELQQHLLPELKCLFGDFRMDVMQRSLFFLSLYLLPADKCPASQVQFDVLWNLYFPFRITGKSL